MAGLHEHHEIAALLQRTRTVAVVGVSADPTRPSHDVASYLLRNTDWTVWFVNPTETETEILGQQVFATLADLPGVPDVVDVFRRREHLLDVTEESIAVGASAVWFQSGLRHDEAAAAAICAGLDVVQDRCLKVDHARLAGRRR